MKQIRLKWANALQELIVLPQKHKKSNETVYMFNADIYIFFLIVHA